MAEEQEEEERMYTIPLRIVKRVPRTKRAPRAIKEVRYFVSKHMKTPLEDVWIDKPLNEAIWKRGIQKPPSKIRVQVIKFKEDGLVEVSLPED